MNQRVRQFCSKMVFFTQKSRCNSAKVLQFLHKVQAALYAKVCLLYAQVSRLFTQSLDDILANGMPFLHKGQTVL
jgi:hypothetical protein